MSKYTKQDIMQMVEDEDVEFIRLQFTDMFGTLKNVAITKSQLEKALNNQCMFDGSSIEGFVRIEESDMYLRPDFYANNLEKVRAIIAPVIEDYKSGKIIYAEAEFDARNMIYQSVKPDLNPDVEYMKDSLSRDIPPVDNSLFILARKVILESK